MDLVGPAWKRRPSGATKTIGVQFASMVDWVATGLQLMLVYLRHEVPLNRSAVLSPPLPETVKTSPNGKATEAVYQRGSFMSATRVQALVCQLKTLERRTMLRPPITWNLPSARSTVPPQNMSCWFQLISVTVPVLGFQTAA